MAEFRLLATGASIVAMGWRSGSAVLAMPDTLREIGIDVDARAPDQPVSLADVAGLSFQFVSAEQAILIQCTTACFRVQRLMPPAETRAPVTAGLGAFLNADLVANRLSTTTNFAGQFELGLFGFHGFGGTSWTAGVGNSNQLVRLDSNWSLDFPDRRVRLSLGDAIAHAGGVGVPFRFGGIQIGTDFSLDPTFVPFPTPSFRGDAATPSVVDYYVNGALRARQSVEPGPFEIIDAPVVTGGGIARIVVTDALGRQTLVEAPFYASPHLLRPGLADFAIAIGAEREGYALESARYGRAFAFGAYRRGLTQWATAEARAEWSSDFEAAAFGLSLSRTNLGQFDISLATSHGENGDGGFASVDWALYGERMAFAADVAVASKDFRHLGIRDSLPERRARATIGLSLWGRGSLSLTGTQEDSATGRKVQTLQLSYSVPVDRMGALIISALHVDDGAPSTVFGLTFTHALGGRANGALSVESRGSGATAVASAQGAPNQDGLGWRASMSQGEINRLEGGVTAESRYYEARLDVSAAPDAVEERAQFASSLSWIDGAAFIARPTGRQPLPRRPMGGAHRSSRARGANGSARL